MNKEQFTEKVLSAEQSLYRIARSILQNDTDCEDAMLPPYFSGKMEKLV